MMIRSLGYLSVLILTLSACKKNDAPPAPPPVDYWLISSMMMETDTVQFRYNADRTVKQVNESPFYDSFKVVYESGRISEFSYLAENVKNLPFQSFKYNGNNLVRINLHGWNMENKWVILDYDSLVYKNGKLAEYHEVYGGVRSRVSKFTWENNNITKEDGFDVDQEVDRPVYTNTYTYSDKTGVQHRLNGQFLFLYLLRDFSLLSDKMLAGMERKHNPGNALFSRTIKDVVLDGDNVVKTTDKTENFDNNYSSTFNTVFEYTKFK